MSLSFRGVFDQKVDGKGRMSIPADFRRALEFGDPDFPEKNANPRMVVLYGPHLKDCLHAYTIDEMAEIEADIKALPRGSVDRKRASQLISSKSWVTEIDRDGRIVLPKDRRDQIELDGAAMMVAMGDYFEIWNAETYAATEGSQIKAYLEKMPENFDPLTLLGNAKGS